MARDRLRFYIIAGEPSGDILASHLVARIKAQCNAQGQSVEWRGVGGVALADQGIQSAIPMADIAIMGLMEIIPHIKQIKGYINHVIADIHDFAPDALITVDSPGFTRRIANRLKADGVTFPLIHYVAPTVWAWRPGRAQKFARSFDHLLTLLPFEPPYFTAVGLDCHFVGHSILESGADQGNGLRLRQKLGLAADTRLICLLPGSRAGEIKRLLPVFLQAAALLHRRYPELQFLLPNWPHLAPTITPMVAASALPIHLVAQVDKYDAFAASSAAIAASGTVALELAMAKVPTIIGYRINKLTHWLLRRLVKIPFVHLLNILAKKMIVPELIQQDCTPGQLADQAAQLLDGAGPLQIQALGPLLALLAPDGSQKPSEKAAALVLSWCQPKK